MINHVYWNKTAPEKFSSRKISTPFNKLVGSRILHKFPVIGKLKNISKFIIPLHSFFQNKQKLRGTKTSKRELLGEGVTRPLVDLGVPDEYAKQQHTLEALRKSTEGMIGSLENNNYAPMPTDMQNSWNPQEGMYPYTSPQPPVARATTPTIGEPQEHYYTQVLSSMEIPTFEDTLKPLSSA